MKEARAQDACAYLRESSAVDEVLDLAEEIGADLIASWAAGDTDR
jgi:hypothetical protein